MMVTTPREKISGLSQEECLGKLIPVGGGDFKEANIRTCFSEFKAS